MVFLHPTILRDPDSADFYSRSKYDDIRNSQLGLFDEKDERTLAARPSLPELQLYFEGRKVSPTADALNTLVPSTGGGPATVPAPEAAPGVAPATGGDRPVIRAVPDRGRRGRVRRRPDRSVRQATNSPHLAHKDRDLAPRDPAYDDDATLDFKRRRRDARPGRRAGRGRARAPQARARSRSPATPRA